MVRAPVRGVTHVEEDTTGAINNTSHFVILV